jgi:hypothetical protein
MGIILLGQPMGEPMWAYVNMLYPGWKLDMGENIWVHRVKVLVMPPAKGVEPTSSSLPASITSVAPPSRG